MRVGSRLLAALVAPGALARSAAGALARVATSGLVRLAPGALAAVVVAIAAVAIAASTVGVATARAEGWRSAQPPAPPPPPGQTGTSVPVPLGHVGQISFWAPNRGLLITAGTEVDGGPIPAGLYYYNGVAWRLFSKVCGGSDGRIAWAGPDDFWTISDQQAGQQALFGQGADLSLCHFQDGRVVASYAEPIGVPNSYQPMHAAACAGASDCWFGGDRLPSGANAGAFHLHWNGSVLTALPSLETPEPQIEDPPQPVVSIAFYRGHLYESVRIEALAPGEQPFLIHKIVEGSSKPFVPMLLEGPPGEAFSGGQWPLQLSGDAGELWAVGGSGGSQDTALLLNAAGQFQQVKLADPSGTLAGESVGGVAAEPGSEDAWLSLDPTSGPESGRTALTRVTRVHADGTVDAPELLPQPGETVGHKGVAGAIACPAAGDCWVASSQGWLFHLGGEHSEDDDPYFQGTVEYRPPDASIPFQAPEDFPEDDSGANPPPLPPLPAPPVHEAASKVRAPLFSHVRERLMRGTTLALSFTLVTRSRVRLLALRRRREVAHTGALVLARGRHTLLLRLARKAWPTRLDLKVKPLGPVPLVPAGSGGGEATGGPTAVTTSVRRRARRDGGALPAPPPAR